MIRTVILACALAGICASDAAAQPISCGDCKKAATEAAPIRNRIQSKHAELDRLRQERAANDVNLDNVRQLRQEASRRNDTTAVNEYEQSIEDLQADNRGNAEQQFKTQQDIQNLNEDLEKLGRDVDACSKRCFETDPGLPTGFVAPATAEVNSGEPPPTGGVRVPPLRVPPCKDCPELPELQKEHEELQRRAKRVSDFGGRQDDLRDFEAQRRKVRELQRKVDDCDKTCQPKPTTSNQTFLKSPFAIGGIGGGVAAIALLAGGGEPPATAATPLNPAAPPVNVAAPTSPQPPAQPAPDAIDLVMGLYLIQSCVCELDPGGHDPFLRLCQSARQVRLARTSQTTGQIDGDTPLIRSDFILDANAQTLDGTAVGLVGSMSVALRYAGTFAPAPPRNLTLSLTYTINNTATRYRVTASKQ